MSKEALIFWFTGLSGSGKSTVASRVKPLLEAQGRSVLLLDGDDIRRRLHTSLGFTEGDIKKNNTLIIDLCKQDKNNYDVILVSIISPYASSRGRARALLGEDFYEVHFSAGIETLIERDIKGLYAKAKRKEISNLIGYSPGAVYEKPQNPDFIIDSSRNSIQESVSGFYKFIIDKSKKRCHGN